MCRFEKTDTGATGSFVVNVNVVKIIFVNLKKHISPFHVIDLFWYPLQTSENLIKKPKVFWCFQWVSKESTGMKWVHLFLIIKIRTPEKRQLALLWCLYNYLWTYFKLFSVVSAVDFEHNFVCWNGTYWSRVFIYKFQNIISCWILSTID